MWKNIRRCNLRADVARNVLAVTPSRTLRRELLRRDGHVTFLKGALFNSIRTILYPLVRNRTQYWLRRLESATGGRVRWRSASSAFGGE
jgi:hypothetical protein